MELLTKEFLDKYPDHPAHMTELSKFIFYRTYSRWLPNQKRRETFKESIARAVEYNVYLSVKEMGYNDFEPDMNAIRVEAETLFDNVFNLRQFLSGRTHWVGGAESGIADKFPLSNFNCAFKEIKKWDDLCEVFYLLLLGTGVGNMGKIKIIGSMPPIRDDFELIHSPYEALPPNERIEATKITNLGNGYVKIYVGDSKEGWVDALKYFLMYITAPEYFNIKHIKFSYNSIRPAGERLKTFGGIASGYQALKEMFEGFEKVIKNQIAPNLEPMEIAYPNADSPQWKIVRPIHILDMVNLIGNNVVVGGVRRTAENFICDEDDNEVIHAKVGINEVDTLHHRRMSNNSIAFDKKPSREKLHYIFELIKKEGEPGFYNMEAARKRRPNAKGFNPCGEVILDSNGVCNLTTVNVNAFVNNGVLDFIGLAQAQALSTRAAMRMTLLDLELPDWDRVHKRDRLIAVSLTGWQDAMSELGYDNEQQANLLYTLSDVAFNETQRYAYILRIPTPLLCTTIKPEGTLSKVAGVSSGLHHSPAPYYIQRIRINANDPLAQLAVAMGWVIHPEVGTPKGEMPKTLVIDFPVKSSAKRTKSDVSVEEQFETYFMFQENYTMHNSSITIHVKPDEWDTCEQIIWDNWDNFIGVTFIADDGGTYALAPEEEITEEEYNKIKSSMKEFDPELLQSFENDGLDETTLEGADGCSGGSCPIR